MRLTQPLKAAHAEIRTQRARIRELLGQLRDARDDHDLSATVSLASAGAWAIMRAQRRAAAARVQIQIVAPSAGQVLRLLEQASLA